MSRDMPIGLCCVCDGPLDLSDAGICKTCGNGFCWNQCGSWHGGQHACTNCHDPDADDDAPPDGMKEKEDVTRPTVQS